MTANRTSVRLVGIALLASIGVVAAACDDAVTRQATPAGPSGPPSPAGPAAPTSGYSLWIVSGADGSPVRGAAVVIEGRAYQSDDRGKVTVAAPLGAWATDVEAAGFLPRRTTTAANQVISLWPAANDAEAEALRQMVYQRGGARDGVLYPPDSGQFLLTIDQASNINSPDARDAWRREAIVFGSMFGLSYELSYAFQYETNEVAVRVRPAGTAGCVPVPAWGFCRDSPWYKSFTVLPEKATDPATIRRVLASWFLGPNPLPGFMNADAPADDFSPLEMQTIRMILQRPVKNRWPDDDRW